MNSRHAVLLGLLLSVVLGGCQADGRQTATLPAGVVTLDNPVHVPLANHQFVWDTTVNVVERYFVIRREDAVRLVGSVLTEGRIDAGPQRVPTIFEPWHEDAAGSSDRIEATLQSLRHRAVVRVTPSRGGFDVHVAVFKELEDVPRPEHATAGAATFRYDGSLRREAEPVGSQPTDEGWIAAGRDTGLEQVILARLQRALGGYAEPSLPVPAPLDMQEIPAR